MRCRRESYIRTYLPYAIANIKGSDKYSNIKGIVEFYPFKGGSLIKLEIKGLPTKNKNNFFGFHIHEGNECKSKENDPFGLAGNHLNPEKDEHPNHLGDLPIIYSNNGYAYIQFYTSRFTKKDIINHVVIVHEKEDDLKSQPSGSSGEKIACGVIESYN